MKRQLGEHGDTAATAESREDLEDRAASELADEFDVEQLMAELSGRAPSPTPPPPLLTANELFSGARDDSFLGATATDAALHLHPPAFRHGTVSPLPGSGSGSGSVPPGRTHTALAAPPQILLQTNGLGRWSARSVNSPSSRPANSVPSTPVPTEHHLYTDERLRKVESDYVDLCKLVRDVQASAALERYTELHKLQQDNAELANLNRRLAEQVAQLQKRLQELQSGQSQSERVDEHV
ncbi:hypothetical protein CDCA_CDCA07G2042 [Cyanidium caldarium]|uniref:Uncharacterized protein n=1 Tax=Cyanidium caldarium TaxID=2771 RepID=A0AAV9IUS9_CYACA|nr:hypothetical protein CDCA_CDCA07G2042 [Cyanidium caldarium]|eukprot:ctg_824.g275